MAKYFYTLWAKCLEPVTRWQPLRPHLSLETANEEARLGLERAVRYATYMRYTVLADGEIPSE